MKVKLLRRIRKLWKIYENPRWQQDKDLFRYHSYRNGKHMDQGEDLHKLKIEAYKTEAMKVLFWSYTDLENRKADRRKKRYKNRLVQVYP